MRILVGSIIAGIFYRMGGSSRFHTLWRDISLPLIMVLSMLDMGFKHWTLIASVVLFYGSLTTYWDFVNKWFGQSEDEFWLNWALTGIGYSLAMIPTVIAFNPWKGFFIRTFFLPVFFVASDFAIEWFHSNVKQIQNKTRPKEFCRGFFTIATLPILSIK